MTAYDRVLLCDTDLLFRGDVSALFEMESEVRACPDGANLPGKGRNADGFSIIDGNLPGALSATFNAGVMAFRRAALGEAVYQSFLAQLDRFANGELTGDHRDQLIFNLLFRDRCSLLDVRYNFLVGFCALAEQATDADIATAAVLHFNGPFKPWNPAQSLDLSRLEPRLKASLGEWSRTYLDCLARMKDRSHAA